jgi:hypothetical protein
MDTSYSTSIFLARLIGPVCAVLGIALAFNGATFRALAKSYLDNHALVFLFGLVSLPTGLAIVLTHNVWAADWRLLITLLGWLAVVGGILRLVAPQRGAQMGREMLVNPANTTITGLAYLAIGAVLCFFGYFR